MLDYLYEIKTSRRNSTLDSQRFRVEEANKIFDPIKHSNDSDMDKHSKVNPIEMESVHINIEKETKKKGILKIFKKNRK